MSKLVSWIAVILLLCVVPFGSWLYLSKGLNYRKAALSELQVKDSLSISEDSLRILNNKTTVLVLNKEVRIMDILGKINDQFKNSPSFQIMFKDSVGTYSYLPKGYLDERFLSYQGKDFILIDNKLQIRNSYNSDVPAIKKMVEHIAIILPRVKEADIIIKK
ncbi:MAG: hypothetical protein IPJ39_03220 [Saprospiraceae bacterium]|nr:hypothetical protein [Saprospiraceae bacterium]